MFLVSELQKLATVSEEPTLVDSPGLDPHHRTGLDELPSSEEDDDNDSQESSSSSAGAPTGGAEPEWNSR